MEKKKFMKYKTQLLIMLVVWLVPAIAIWVQRDNSSNETVLYWTGLMLVLISVVVIYQAVTKKK